VIINGGPTAWELSSVLAHMRMTEAGGGILCAMPRSQRRRTRRCKDTVCDLCSDHQTSLWLSGGKMKDWVMWIRYAALLPQMLRSGALLAPIVGNLTDPVTI
jgi:hypothetical protein